VEKDDDGTLGRAGGHGMEFDRAALEDHAF
jgi:hypothetical protein